MTASSKCLNYIKRCHKITLDFKNPDMIITKLTFYIVDKAFNSILPNYEPEIKTFPFIGGEIQFKVADWFYGIQSSS